jgi:LDH2 family malate/lactate/ureidoglycolate dehydrogenase
MSATGEVTTVAPGRIRSFSIDALVACGMSTEDATTVADALVWADLRGISAQGIAKLPLIVRRLRAGGSDARAQIETVSERGAFVVLDARRAWGHVAGVRAMREAIARARAQGMGLAVVRNTDSASALGYYASLAAAQGLVALAINDGTPLMPPVGGTTRVVGNQAFAIAAPRADGAPLLFDSALSMVSWTEIEELRARGEPLRDGLALDRDGRPTTDHAAAIAGMLLPMGAHRGFGLALMWEVLTGILSGNERFASRITPLAEIGRPQSVAQFHLAIDPALAGSQADFAKRIERLIATVHTSPPASGVDRIFVPGERSAESAVGRERDGVRVPAAVAEELASIAGELGIERSGLR